MAGATPSAAVFSPVHRFTAAATGGVLVLLLLSDPCVEDKVGNFLHRFSQVVAKGMYLGCDKAPPRAFTPEALMGQNPLMIGPQCASRHFAGGDC